jgi:hypothetical protein
MLRTPIQVCTVQHHNCQQYKSRIDPQTTSAETGASWRTSAEQHYTISLYAAANSLQQVISTLSNCAVHEFNVELPIAPGSSRACLATGGDEHSSHDVRKYWFNLMPLTSVSRDATAALHTWQTLLASHAGSGVTASVLASHARCCYCSQ